MTEVDVSTIELSAIEQWLDQLAPKAFDFLLQVVIAVIVYLIGQRIINVIRKIAKKALEKRDSEPGLVLFIDSCVKVALYALLIVVILTLFGVTTASVVAVVGSAGLTVGLALQGSLSNFAGGVLILILKPFVVGDYIVEHGSGREGVVTAISVFYTTLTTADNKMVVIPNGTLSNSSITNLNRVGTRRCDFNVSVSYATDLKKAKEVLLMLARRDEAVMDDPAPIAFVKELGDSGIDMELRVWVKSEDYWAVTFRMLEEIKMAFDEEGIDIPFPQMDVKIKSAEA
ncbi:MAG: mechanosensitive ion channel family protein [Lachnospiraceae bacterium]|nr:mechanosensitive ion channel family protein [Lachnospiraceae bacterium]